MNPDSILITTIKFHGTDVKKAMERAEKLKRKELWLLRTQMGVYITTSEQDCKFYPQSISKTTSTLLSRKPQPYVEVIPLHNCVLKKLGSLKPEYLPLVWFEFQMNDICEYRLHLTSTSGRFTARK